MATSNCSSVDKLISLKLDAVGSAPSSLSLSSAASSSTSQSPRSLSPIQQQQQIPSSPTMMVVEQAPPSSPHLHTTTTVKSNNITNSPSPKRQAKDVLSAQILIGMKNLIPSLSSASSSSTSPNSPLSAPNSPLPIQAPLSPSSSSDTEKPNSNTDHQLPLSHNSPSASNSPIQNNCTFKECLLCKRGSPFVNNQSPTWACIMRIVFYCLQNEITSKPFLNLKTDVYGFMTAHWHLLCLDKKRSDNWHKQIQDMLSHSKNLFESGMDTYKQNGYWRMKQITDPWEEIKSKKVISKRKRSYSEADKDHSSKNNNNNSNNSNNSSVVSSPAPSATATATTTANATVTVPISPLSSTTSSIDKKIHENFHQLSSQLNKNKETNTNKTIPTPPINLALNSQVAAPISSSKSISTPRLKKKQKVDHLIPGLSTQHGSTNNTNNNNATIIPTLVVNQAPIPTLPIISMLDESSLKIDDSDVEVNIEDDVEEIKHYDDDQSSMSLLLLSSTAVESSSKLLLPMVRDQQQPTTRSSSVAETSASFTLSSSSSNLANTGGNTSAPTSPPTVSSPSSLLLIKEEEISLLKQQLQLICSNLTIINQSDDPSTVQSMIEKEIKRISNICSNNNHHDLDKSSSAITSNASATSFNKSPKPSAITANEAPEDDCVPNLGLSSLMVALFLFCEFCVVSIGMIINIVLFLDLVVEIHQFKIELPHTLFSFQIDFLILIKNKIISESLKSLERCFGFYCYSNYTKRIEKYASWKNKLQTLDLKKDGDVDEIIKFVVGYDFPFEMFLSLNFCFYRTFCSPTIAGVYAKTGVIANTTDKRACDTDLLMHIWMDYGLDSTEGKASYEQLNKIHGLHSAKTRNVDFVFVLSCLVIDAIQFTRDYGWRSIEEKEKQAIWEFYRRVGERMEIKDLPKSLDDCYQMVEKYTEDERSARITEDGVALTEAITKLVCQWYYFIPQPILRMAVSVILYQMGATFQRKLGLTKPTFVQSLFVNTILQIRRALLNVVPLRTEPFKLSDSIMKSDYGCPISKDTIKKVGPVDVLARIQ
ncbi:hypothetical protein PPL_04775 [Heterostelium album PN500]|uniref:ER-bound oxygenase mpaB/mpaB'/Rubber oxygenase catalytic domain-containing protein n=1 Tax=Heterostelium pallidum (strain ATCC 26659 / Pp 5 / PN500) TaxID=670386 RepID=D3B8I2_HETP5|nr:hypothetical protein PPL_04775 [Heterostelium album PN500]EFA82350.1 hypothetical protein PPL_04775 [Heterostelium album PN500]|eukprot:XP_020434467.1 hypothetical protein PPL_04775 [Heterostelium album PN500]